MERGGTTAERKVMVVVDPTRESAAALQYALAHAVVENDTLILLHVVNANFWRNTISFLATLKEGGGGAGAGAGAGAGTGDVEFLAAMKYACQIAQPKVRVHVEKVEMDGKDKATVILSQSTERGVDLLVVGKRQSISNAILG